MSSPTPLRTAPTVTPATAPLTTLAAPPLPVAPGGTGPKPPAVQRAATKAVPLRRPAPPAATGAPLPVAPLTPPAASAPRPALPVASAAPAPPAADSVPAAPADPAVTAASAAPGEASAFPVQRAFGRGSRAGRTTGALAASAAAALTETFTRLRPHSSPQGPAEPPPPPYSASPPGGPPPYVAVPAAPNPGEGQRPPEYTAVPDGGFDPRQLTEFQLDELVHRIVGRVTRLVRTELRMDRERIGRLRDPR
ncbi:hypothetical protein ABZT26_07600 [Streptomyces sp. NPDC005395]|uniref:hypothetical protein n=1 Tax=Streptomyces sp. NPDC005395 TaxID=3157042 RepID=UPI0033A79807